jgi:hypothetical protein
MPEISPRISPRFSPDVGRHKREWHRYYSEKRIFHQWTQVHLLQDLPVSRVLEIGPHLGLVTAMLCNAGYDTVTLDIEECAEPDRHSPKVERIVGDVRALDAETLRARRFDAILCCEVLEHLPYETVDSVLDRLAAIGARTLVLSVPYMGDQLTFEFYANRHGWRKYTSLKMFKWLRRFPAPADPTDWEPHKWEIGYAKVPLADFRALIERRFRVLRTVFTGQCRSVFFVCENTGAGDRP